MSRGFLACAAAVAASGLIALWLWAETLDARASRSRLGAASAARHSAGTAQGTAAPHTHAVVVLGYGNRGERANFVNRFRVRAGIRSLDPTAENVLVLCGGPVHSATPEAVIMQRCARDLGFRGPIELDETSRSTRENIANAIPMIEHADTIAIVSNAPHAERGRELLWLQRPDLAARLVRGAEHRFGATPVMTILGALRVVQAKLTGEWDAAARNR
ncbi:YdcF family protein [Microbacterium sp. ARD32]|uniref:YdcF family protein n=1 Tax=Microbacterium sp. ARD32 TaxID=2962577 RepID=UPI0028822E4D|nr:YdcF family protein [Microbacterium sp. ARD32]MDT0156704.1 YdcF family protein [Microbacterium sp. ARD32]